MRRSLAAIVALLLVLAAPARAQNGLLADCAAQPVPPEVPAQLEGDIRQEFRAVCGRVVNALSAVQPTVGIAFSGGNPVLGTGTTFGTAMGVVPHINATARVNVAFAEVPDIGDGTFARLTGDSLPGATLEAVSELGVPIGAVQGDLSVGLFNGFSLGPVQGVGAVDLLGSAAFLPEIDQLHMNSPIVNVGGGARIGLLEQSALTPGISVSLLYRKLIRDIDIGDVDRGDLGEFHAGLSTFSVRGVVSKGLLFFNFAAGAGYDSYSSDVRLRYRLECATDECLQAGGGEPIVAIGELDGELSTAAWNVFGNIGFELPATHIVAEVGYQKSTDVITAEDLRASGLPAAEIEELGGGRIFGSLGVRLSF